MLPAINVRLCRITRCGAAATRHISVRKPIPHSAMRSPVEKCSPASSPCSCFRWPSTRRSMPARTARRASATPTGRASACCRPRPPIARRGCWSSPAAPAAGRAFSPSIAGSCSSRRTPTTWTRYDVVGWGQPVRTNGWAPDGRWFGDTPRVLVDVRGRAGRRAHPEGQGGDRRRISYSQFGDYRVWPGPNSNTFTATVLRAVPELQTTLPPNAVGKDFRALALCRPDRQPHRRRGFALGPARREGSAGSRASSSTSWGWSPVSICAIRRSSCRASAASASTTAPRWRRR